MSRLRIGHNHKCQEKEIVEYVLITCRKDDVERKAMITRLQ